MVKKVIILGQTGVISNIIANNIINDNINNSTDDSANDISDNSTLTINDFYNFVGPKYATKIKIFISNIDKDDIDKIEVDREGYKNNIEKMFLIKSGNTNVGINFDKEENKISLFMNNFNDLSKQTTNAFYEYGLPILSDNSSIISNMQDSLIEGLAEISNLLKVNKSNIEKDMVNGVNKVYSENMYPMNINTSYGSYFYGLEVYNRNINAKVGITTNIQ